MRAGARASPLQAAEALPTADLRALGDHRPGLDPMLRHEASLDVRIGLDNPLDHRLISVEYEERPVRRVAERPGHHDPALAGPRLYVREVRLPVRRAPLENVLDVVV